MISTLASTYLARYRDAAQEHGDTINGPCPYCGGGTDRFMIWKNRADNLGKTCTQYNIPGVFYCRQCQKSGDAIEYLMTAEGMDFPSACAELGIRLPAASPAARAAAAAAAPPVHFRDASAGAFHPRTPSAPPAIWQEHAARIDARARAAFTPQCTAAAYVAARGIPYPAAVHYGLGLVQGENGRDVLFRTRESFGLPPKTAEDGSPVRRLCIRRGLSIPTRNAAGDIMMFRVRRPNADVQPHQGKYWELPGGSGAAFHLPPARRPLILCYIIVEAELDAILLHALAGGAIGTAAMRNATNKPDAETAAALSRADLILCSLDADEAGARGSAWWTDHYRARYTPVPVAKDPGDAFKAGFDLRAWLESILPPALTLPPPFSHIEEPAAPPSKPCGSATGTPEREGRGAPSETAENAAAAAEKTPAPQPVSAPFSAQPNKSVAPFAKMPEQGACAPQNAGGVPREPESAPVPPAAPASAPPPAIDENAPAAPLPPSFAPLFTPAVRAVILPQVPSYLDPATVPDAVLLAAHLWHGTPVVFIREQNGGFSWEAPEVFKTKNAAFRQLSLLYMQSRPFREWLHSHAAAEINARNILKIFG